MLGISAPCSHREWEMEVHRADHTMVELKYMPFLTNLGIPEMREDRYSRELGFFKNVYKRRVHVPNAAVDQSIPIREHMQNSLPVKNSRKRRDEKIMLNDETKKDTPSSAGPETRRSRRRKSATPQIEPMIMLNSDVGRLSGATKNAEDLGTLNDIVYQVSEQSGSLCLTGQTPIHATTDVAESRASLSMSMSRSRSRSRSRSSERMEENQLSLSGQTGCRRSGRKRKKKELEMTYGFTPRMSTTRRLGSQKVGLPYPQSNIFREATKCNLNEELGVQHSGRTASDDSLQIQGINVPCVKASDQNLPKKRTRKVKQLKATALPRSAQLLEQSQSPETKQSHNSEDQDGEWREVDVGTISPMVLIGLSCKIYWPLDKAWYSGAIHDYNPSTGKHQVDYDDNETECLILSKERVKLQISIEEEASLRSIKDCQTEKNIAPDIDELTILAQNAEFCEEKFGQGTVIWAKVKGWPMWPALVLDEERAAKCNLEPSKDTLAVQFFGSCDFARIKLKTAMLFSKGVMHKYHVKCKRAAFVEGLKEVQRYLLDSRFPHKMEHMLETRRLNLEKEDNSKDFACDEGQEAVANSLPKCPLQMGSLCILSLGLIVLDSEHFHNGQYIWPEGYTAERRFTSIKDPSRAVSYKMEVLRSPSMPSMPLFRVTPEDGKPVVGHTPVGCWKKVYEKIEKAKQKSGMTSMLQESKRRQKSGSTMFGFSNTQVSKLIQALPNAKVCSKFISWHEKKDLEDGNFLPAGYKPIEVEWKLERCSVCSMDEEYTDNLLLQCDKCRIMVHMACYGELKAPNGGLWLCQLCQSGAPKQTPCCCLCPVKGGAMKRTTDGRWAHLTCATWVPETCLVDVKRMEPVDGLRTISKERWKLLCSICKVSHGACIQCSGHGCHVAYHPLCARYAGYHMEIREDLDGRPLEGDDENTLTEKPVRFISYCRKHGQRLMATAKDQHSFKQVHMHTDEVSLGYFASNSSGCARSEPFNHNTRRGRREPEAQAAARAKRLFVENMPYCTNGFRRHGSDLKLGLADVNSTSVHKMPLLYQNEAGGLPRKVSAPVDDNQSVEVRSMTQRFLEMRSSLHNRLTFGKSAIHGWGVFVKCAHYAGDMVVEYTGEVVRPNIADIREKKYYNSFVGAGTYMFRIDDERVVDATRGGSIAHLINHSCKPNCYSRVVAADGEDHIIIFAKREITVGEELTYDYRFVSKGDDLTCNCGSLECRGSVCAADDNDEHTSILVLRSLLGKWNPLAKA